MLWMSPTLPPLQSNASAAAAEAQSPPGIQGGSRNAVPLIFYTTGINDTLAMARKKYRAESEFSSLDFW